MYTNDLPLLSQRIEQEILADRFLFWGNSAADGALLYQRVKLLTAYVSKLVTENVAIDFSLPYYEGLNRYNDKYWMSYFGGNARGYEAGLLSLGMAYTTKDPSTAHAWKRLPKPIL